MDRARMRGQLAMLSVLVVCVPLASAAGQVRQIGGGVGITVFTSRDFRGNAATFRQDMPSLSGSLHRQISSVRVAPGEQWEVCDQVNFRGHCVTMSGDNRDLSRNAWGNRIASIRRVRSAAGIIPGPVRSISLFTQPNFRGRSMSFTGPARLLSPANSFIGSVNVQRGGAWQLCSGPNFTGRCVIADRNMPVFGSRLGFRVRSLRPLR